MSEMIVHALTVGKETPTYIKMCPREREKKITPNFPEKKRNFVAMKFMNWTIRYYLSIY